MKTAPNKRKHKRFQCFVPVDGRPGTEFAHIRTVDIGKDGIGFISRKSLPLNKKIAIGIDLNENGDPVFVIGIVRWVRRLSDSDSYRIGMKFADVVTGSRTRLNQYFQQYASVHK